MNSVIDNQIQYDTPLRLAPRGVSCVYQYREDPVTGEDYFTGMITYEFRVSLHEFHKIRHGEIFTIDGYGVLLKMVNFVPGHYINSVEVICIKA